MTKGSLKSYSAPCAGLITTGPVPRDYAGGAWRAQLVVKM